MSLPHNVPFPQSHQHVHAPSTEIHAPLFQSVTTPGPIYHNCPCLQILLQLLSMSQLVQLRTPAYATALRVFLDHSRSGLLDLDPEFMHPTAQQSCQPSLITFDQFPGTGFPSPPAAAPMASAITPPNSIIEDFSAQPSMHPPNHLPAGPSTPEIPPSIQEVPSPLNVTRTLEPEPPKDPGPSVAIEARDKHRHFRPYLPNDTQKAKPPKTPCPKCLDHAYTSSTEFEKHMTSCHDRPVRYICNHFVKGKRTYCGFSAYAFSHYKRHHTQMHDSVCKVIQSQDQPAPGCREEELEERPVRRRGCWCCVNLSQTGRMWVEHHLSEHRFSDRKSMTRTWAMRSLLTQSEIQLLWQMQILREEIRRRGEFEIWWSEDAEDIETPHLIECLETTYYEDKSFCDDRETREKVVKAAMRAALTRKLADLTDEQVIIKKTEYKHLWNLVNLGNTTMQFTSHTQELKRAAPSSPTVSVGDFPTQDRGQTKRISRGSLHSTSSLSSHGGEPPTPGFSHQWQSFFNNQSPNSQSGPSPSFTLPRRG